MEEKLKSINVKRQYFFHNVTSYPDYKKSQKGKYDFIWVNRLIKERYSNWFIDALNNPIFINTKNVLLGIQNENEQSKYVSKYKPQNLQVHKYSNPKIYYENASFFVLPAEIIFANNSLLEAMSYGVIPLVSKAEGTNLIVKNGINGFVFDNYEEFLDCMIKAHNLSEIEYLRLSNNARETIKNKFSVEYYADNLLKLYKSLY